MLEKEKVWMFSYMPSRRLQAKPDEARAAKRPASTPQARLIKASTSMMAP